jgi:hypothetical protein
MTTLKGEVENVRDEVRDLLDTARQHSEVSSEYLERLTDLQYDTELAIVRAAELTHSELTNLQLEVGYLRTELASSIGGAALVLRGGQEQIAKAIKAAAGDNIAAAAVSGFMGMFGSAIAGAIAGRLVADAIEYHADAAKPTPATNSLLAKRQAAIFSIKKFQDKRAYLTYPLIVDRLSDDEYGIMAKSEARVLVLNLISEGVLEQYLHDTLEAVRLNCANDEVKAISNDSPNPPVA